MNLKFDYNNMMTDAIGDKGICPCAFEKNAAAIDKAYASVMAGRGKAGRNGRTFRTLRTIT
ncbi:MAG: hypothetical protein ACLUSP_02265 [Christensenellales bacterium]